jgi:hypothetical protein
MNRAVPRPSGSTVATLKVACHAGRRGFESRRSRLAKMPASRGLRVVSIGAESANSGSKRAAPDPLSIGKLPATGVSRLSGTRGTAPAGANAAAVVPV